MLPQSSDADRVEKYVDDFTEERLGLLEKLASKYKGDKMQDVVWAFLLVSDLKKLRKLHDERKTFEELIIISAELRAWAAIRLWTQKSTRPTPAPSQASSSARSRRSTTLRETQDAEDSTPPWRDHSDVSPATPLGPGDGRTAGLQSAGSSKTSLTRSRQASKNCKYRDKVCVVTMRELSTQSAHIYPFFALERNPRSLDFWKFLDLVWDEEITSGWRGVLFPIEGEGGRETVKNLILLAPDVHQKHAQCRFALRPLDATPRQLRLEYNELHYNKDYPHSPQTMETWLRSPLGRRGARVKLEIYYEAKDGNVRRAEDGQRTALRTIDPENLALPDEGLLELQWRMQRVTAMLRQERQDDGGEYDYPWFVRTTGYNIPEWLDLVEPESP